MMGNSFILLKIPLSRSESVNQSVTAVVVMCYVGGSAAWWSHCLHSEGRLRTTVCSYQSSTEWSCIRRRRSSMLSLLLSGGLKWLLVILLTLLHVCYVVSWNDETSIQYSDKRKTQPQDA